MTMRSRLVDIMEYTIIYRVIAILLFLAAIANLFITNEYEKAFVHLFAGILLFFKDVDVSEKTIILLICLAADS